MTKRESVMSKINKEESILNEMISHVDDWKGSKEMRNILLGQINRQKRKIDMLKGEVKAIDVYNKCKNKIKSYMN